MDNKQSGQSADESIQTRRSVLRQTVRFGAFGGMAIGINSGFRLADRRPAEYNNDPPGIIGHRGYALESPENTLRAVSTAATTADAVEVDVRRCGSGELVVIHDSTVDRVTDGNGEVRNLTYDQLAELSVLGTDQRIPLLKEVFETAPESVGIVLDLKERGIASDAVSIGTSFDHKLLVTAFDPAIIEAVNDLPTAVSTGLIVRESRWVNRRLRSWIPGALPWLYGPEDVDSMVANAKQLGCTAILPRYELCLRTSLLESAREADIRVNAWTIAERDTANKLDAVGIDGLIADRAGLL